MKTGVLQSGYPKSATAFFGLPAGTYYDRSTRSLRLGQWSLHFRHADREQLNLEQRRPDHGRRQQKNNPTGGWSIIKLQVGATGECPDYPTMGHDSNNWGKNGTKGAMMSDIEICRHSTVHGVYHQQHVWTLEFKSETRVANRGFAGIRIFLADCGRLSVLHRPRLNGLVVPGLAGLWRSFLRLMLTMGRKSRVILPEEDRALPLSQLRSRSTRTGHQSGYHRPVEGQADRR